MLAVADDMSHMLAQASATGQWLAGARASQMSRLDCREKSVKRVRAQLEYYLSRYMKYTTTVYQTH